MQKKLLLESECSLNRSFPFRKSSFLRPLYIAVCLFMVMLFPLSASADGVEEIQRLLGILSDRLNAGESIDSINVGTPLHRAIQQVWDKMADMEHTGIKRVEQFTGKRGKKVYAFGPEIDVTYYDKKKGKLVTAKRPRFEVWIEKAVGVDSNRIADQVIIDHQPDENGSKKIIIRDITSRSLEDPKLREMEAKDPFSDRYQGYHDHEARNYERADEMKKLLKRRGIEGYDVTVDDNPRSAHYYKTYLERLHSEGRTRGRRERLRIRENGSSASMAAKAVIGTLLVSIAIDTIMPNEARAAQSMDQNAAKDFEEMMRLYIQGRHTEADRIFKWWQHADATIYAKQLFPNMSDGAALLFAEGFLIPYIKNLREASRHLHEARLQCMREKSQRIAKVRKEARKTHQQIREQMEYSFETLYHRIMRWQRRLRDISEMRGDGEFSTATMPEGSWKQLAGFIGKSDKLFHDIHRRQRELDKKLDGITAEGTEAFLKDYKDSLGLSYSEYWAFLIVATDWAQQDIVVRQKAEKQRIRMQYNEQVKALKDANTATDDPQWKDLREQFAPQEGTVDRLMSRKLNDLYETFMYETKHIAGMLNDVGGRFVPMARGMTALDNPASPISMLTKFRMIAGFDSLVYENVPEDETRYSTELSFGARQHAERILKTSTPDDGEIAILAVWIDDEQARVADLDKPIKEGAKLTIWAEVIKGEHPGEHEWPIGPPPGSKFVPSGQMRWFLDGVEPQEGQVFRIKLPEVTEVVGQSLQLRIMHPTAKQLVKNLTIRANREPGACLSVPSEGYVKVPLRIAWQVADEDHYNPLSLRVEFEQGEASGTAHIKGKETFSSTLSRKKDFIEVNGSTELLGHTSVTWYERGDYTVRAVFSDGQKDVERTYRISIKGNHPPVIDAWVAHSGTIRVGEEFRVVYKATDEDEGDSLKFFIKKLPESFTIVKRVPCESAEKGKRCTAVLKGREEGHFDVDVAVRDSKGAEDSRVFRVTIGNPPADCSAIDCDCSSIDMGFGFMTREYRRECRGVENSLKEQCEATGKITGSCHPTAQGPNAWPK